VDEALAPLLEALAESLNVREIFARISAAAQRIVPHDFLMLGLLTDDGARVQVLALSSELGETAIADVALTGALRLAVEQGTFVLDDMQPQAGTDRIAGWIRKDGGAARERFEVEDQPFFRQLVDRGLLSYLRVPVRLRGGLLGGLIFCAKEHAYASTDVVRARQIAACVALALAHQRLAEEEKRSARLEARVERLTAELEARSRHRVIGQSPKWRDVLGQATKVAPTEATVFLSGESGTGKEVLARFVHRASARAKGPFVALNCAALPENLLESELFGHERGAFTGALQAYTGKIEQAAGGVLFLDEVGEMSPHVQAKFLRLLQEREYQRLGGTRTLKADVRVLAATNRDLKAAISQGGFREDLYYRLAVFEIVLPPLRERREDIALLLDTFLEEIGRDVGRPAAGISPEARAHLAGYAWPGNVRELRNAIERAVILCDGGAILPEHLPLGIVTAAPTVQSANTLESTERQMILDALARAGNNKSKAARILGLTRAQLRSRIEKHGLSIES
jgi:transcriptional regulator with GAF, ATPase, and Fis domain